MKKLILLAGIAGAALSHAGIIYDNGGPNLANAWELSNFTEADDIKLDAPATFNTIRFWTLEYSAPISDLKVTIANNYGDNLPSDLFSVQASITSRAVTGRTAFGLSEVEYTAYVGEIPAYNQIPFYVELHANDLSNPNHDYQYIYWETADDNNTQIHLTRQDGGDWNTYDYGAGQRELAFRLEENATPEPATMAVLGLGAAALIRRRKK